MTAEIIQFIPRPNPDRDRKLAEEAAKILAPFVETTGYTDTSPCEMNPQPMTGMFSSLTEEQKAQARAYRGPETIPYGGTGIDGIWTDTDPA